MLPLHQALQTGLVEKYSERERQREMRSIKELNRLILKNAGTCHADGNNALKHVMQSTVQRNAI